ncbi:IS110 family RNA-guided transposase [Geochorda subterranea]|uniref:IS110 family transposase n=1 Tax=Geochorda subterranea TaxID=3109564 RepID=A0ABZ1BTC5_9FIRM|nr:IS110 family transposase [Limnochorda sp. LNt]WRP15781.1 IS110 family transposase [Limnochorda sp. LNt]
MRRYIGLDVHRDYCYAYLLESGQKEGRRRRFPNAAEDWAGFVEELGPHDAVAIEVSGGTFRLYDTLADRAGQVVAVDPRVMRRLGSRKRKTDHDDAKLLAERLALGTLPGVWVPPKPIRQLRALVNLRRQLVEQRAPWKNQMRSLLQRHGYRTPRNLWQARRHLQALWELDLPPADRVALGVALDQVRSTNTHLQTVEREIGQRVKNCPPVRLLLSLPGFSVITAATYYAYIGDPLRFPSDKHVASYTGLVPRVYQSGTTDRRGPITKEGPPVLRWTLVEAASSVAHHGPPALRAFYERLRVKKGHQVAVVALAAKLARIAWAMWRTGRLFAGIRPELYAAKLSVLDRHAAPYPTIQVLTWLAERLDQILDRNPYAVKQGRKEGPLDLQAAA